MRHFWTCGVVTLLNLAGAMLPGMAFSQELWNGTRHGMTVEQVQATVPGAVPPANPGTLVVTPPLTDVRKAHERLRVESFSLANRTFGASFYFYEGRLIEVVLWPRDKLTDLDAESLYDHLVTGLRQKYGREVDSGTDADRGIAVPGSNERFANWFAGKTKISLSVIRLNKLLPVMTLSYSVVTVTDVDKL